MAGAGIRSFAKFRGQMPQIATTGITSWQTSVCGNPRDGYSILGNQRSERR
jgi:hypothetical protein